MDDAAENAELVRRIVAHDGTSREAEAALCTRFGPRAQLYGRKHLRDEDRARDLAQAVLLAVLEAARAGRIEDPAHLDRFVLGTCRNLAHRMRDVDARAQPTDVAELDVRSFVPEATSLDVGALTQCLSKLDPRARSVVFLSFHEEKAAEEIATALDTTPGNVRVLRHRAIAQLRRCLDQEDTR